MTRAGTGRIGWAFTGAANGLLGGSLSFFVTNRPFLAWLIAYWEDLRPLAPWRHWEWWPDIMLDMGLRLLAGVAAGAVAGACLGRSLRVVFWAGLVAGFVLALAVPPIPMVRE
jgi:hypothetical protein